MTFICHPTCTTCKKARAFLEERGAVFEIRDIRTENPSAEELLRWKDISGLPMKRFFNTSGMLYREMNVKAQLDEGMTDDEALALLATNGMLVKRPLVIGEDFVLVGFKESEWREKL